MPNRTPSDASEMPPETLLLQLGMSYYPSRVLTTSLQFGLFSRIAQGHRTAEAVARSAGTSVRGTQMLLDALVGLQLLIKKGTEFSLNPVSDQFLRKESPDYIGAMMEDDHLWEVWGKLPEVVRSGKPVARVESQEGAEAFFPTLIKSLHVMNRRPAQALAKALGAGTSRKGLRVLDVACGSGVWSIAIAEADRDAKLTAQDFPKVLDHTKTFLRKHEVDSRYSYIAGDLKTADLGEGKFDVVILGNIVHSEGERSSRELFRKAARALVPGGKIAIIDMIPNDERTAPPFPLFFALNMLVNTEEGSTYTLAEYTAWLKDAGFSKVETVDIHSHSPAVIGIR